MTDLDRLLSLYSDPVKSWPEKPDEWDTDTLLPFSRRSRPVDQKSPDQWISQSDVMRTIDARNGAREGVPGVAKSPEQWGTSDDVMSTIDANLGRSTQFAWPRLATDIGHAIQSVGSSPLIGKPFVPSENPEMTDEMIGHAGAVVGPMAGVGMGRAAMAPHGGSELGIFGGRLAKTADHAALGRAEEMAGQGVPREQIWKDTGWFQGKDGKWRFEIDDSKSRWNPEIANAGLDAGAAIEGFRGGFGRSPKMDDLFDHKALYDAYPGSEKIGVEAIKDLSARGSYDNAGMVQLNTLLTDDNAVKSTNLHELQHAVQQREDFSRGYNPIEAAKDIAQARFREQELRDKTQRWQNAHTDEARVYETRARNGDPEAAEIVKSSQRWIDQLGAKSDDNPYGITPTEAIAAEIGERDAILQRALKEYNDVFKTARLSPDELYRMHAGEVEARAVQARRDLTPDQRRERFPWLDYDVPESQQIVRFGDRGPQMSTSEGPPVAPKSLDNLGYFSPTIEAALRLRQPKGTPEQMLAMLKKEGAKEGEIEATGLNSFLAGKKSVTQDEIMRHLEGNRVGLNEVSYAPVREGIDKSSPYALPEVIRAAEHADSTDPGDLANALANNANAQRALMQRFPELRGNREWPDIVEENLLGAEGNRSAAAKWQDHSLDPSNPTYRETVLHLSDADIARSGYDFVDSHFPEHRGTVGHMMTELLINPDDGKKVFGVTQIQSTGGQALRDTLDPAKAVGLRSRLAEMGVSENAADITRIYSTQDDAVGFAKAGARHYGTGQAKSAVSELEKLTPQQFSEVQRVAAELKQINDQMVAPIARHPLVNTTDQWTNTTLRRALRQAVDADAEYVAIPTGDTVLSYNPGDEHGMHGFYGKLVRDDAGDGYGWKPEKEGIVPKNMRKLLRTIDKEAPSPTYTDTLDSPSGKTHLGDGFTLFKITPKIRQAVKQQGQPLFSFAGPNPIPGTSLQEPRSVEDILQSYSPKD